MHDVAAVAAAVAPHERHQRDGRRLAATSRAGPPRRARTPAPRRRWRTRRRQNIARRGARAAHARARAAARRRRARPPRGTARLRARARGRRSPPREERAEAREEDERDGERHRVAVEPRRPDARLVPVSASEISGKKVPQKITKQSPTSSEVVEEEDRLAREQRLQARLRAQSSARRDATSATEPTMSTAMKTRNGMPSVEPPKAWIDWRIPERTRKVPRIARMPVASTSETFHAFSMPRFSWIMNECRKAVPVSHGISDGVLDRVPRPVAAPAELGPRPARADEDPDAEEAARPRARSGASRGSTRRPTRRVISAATANAKGTVNSV